MKTLRKLRYYCDHCKKSGGQSASMRKHEAGCTANPERRCGMCAWREIAQQEMAALIKGAAEGLDALKTIADNCPACMLAGIRQCRKKFPADWDEEGFTPDGVHSTCADWKYKEAAAQFYKEYPDDPRDKRERALMAMSSFYELAGGVT